MGVDDSLYVGTHAIDRRMHHDLARTVPLTFDLLAVQIANDQVFGLHHALADPCRSSENAVGGQPETDVAVVCGDPALLVSQTADFYDLLARILISTRHILH